jgi:hypothetical protein
MCSKPTSSFGAALLALGNLAPDKLCVCSAASSAQSILQSYRTSCAHWQRYSTYGMKLLTVNNNETVINK